MYILSFHMLIPVISATHFDQFLPTNPIHSDRLFWRIPAGPSERSDPRLRYL